MSIYKNVPPDARDEGLVYPNYNIFRTPSGHNLTFDDSKGAESVTLQHASGASFQFLPDGSSVYRSEKDNYEVVLGDKTVVIKGTVTLVINGNCDTKIEGDYNLIVHGNMTTSVGGNMQTVIADNDLKQVGGNKETAVGKTSSLLVTGPIEQVTDDTMYVGAKNNIKVQSIEKDIYVQAEKDIRMMASQDFAAEAERNMDNKVAGNYKIQTKGNYSVNSASKITMSSTQKATLKSTNFVGIDGLKLFFNSNISDPAPEASQA